MKSNNDRKWEFSFRLSRKKIEAFRKCSSEEKLVWLEEVNEFIDTFVSVEKRELWAKLCGSGRKENIE